MAYNKPNVNLIWAGAGEVIAPAAAKINQGWIAEIPDYEFENWIQNRQDQFNAHINQFGIPVWDASTEYVANKSYVQGSDGEIYRALTTHTNSNPTVSTTNWVKAFDNFDASYTKTEADSKFLDSASNLSDLTNTATSRTNLSVYSKTEGDARYLRGSNNLSEVTNVGIARTNLDVYSRADLYTKTQSDNRFLIAANNLSDVNGVAIARANIGALGEDDFSAQSLVTGDVQLAQDPGYQIFPGGLMLQWGRVYVGTDAAVTVITYPMSQIFQVQATLTRDSASNLGVSTYDYNLNRFTVRNSDAAQDIVFLVIGQTP